MLYLKSRKNGQLEKDLRLQDWLIRQISNALKSYQMLGHLLQKAELGQFLLVEALLSDEVLEKSNYEFFGWSYFTVQFVKVAELQSYLTQVELWRKELRTNHKLACHL